MAIKIIAAMAENGVIGRGDELPWRLKDDLRWFKESTRGHPILMGSKTFDSIIKRNHKPLPDRENIVLTKRPRARKCDGVTFTNDFNQLLVRAKRENIFVIGGSEIYNLALPIATQLFLTRVHAEVEGDVFFPKAPRWNPDEWTLEHSDHRSADERNEFPFTWEIHNRKPDRYIYMPNVRTMAQLESMQEIREAGVCPFCPEHSSRWHTKEKIWEGDHWFVSENMWPYPWTQGGGRHLMLFLKTHAESAVQVPDGAWGELGKILSEMEKKFGIPGGGLFMRFGDPEWTGATLRHIHAHIGQKSNPSLDGIFYL